VSLSEEALQAEDTEDENHRASLPLDLPLSLGQAQLEERRHLGGEGEVESGVVGLTADDVDEKTTEEEIEAVGAFLTRTLWLGPETEY